MPNHHADGFTIVYSAYSEKSYFIWKSYAWKHPIFVTSFTSAGPQAVSVIRVLYTYSSCCSGFQKLCVGLCTTHCRFAFLRGAVAYRGFARPAVPVQCAHSPCHSGITGMCTLPPSHAVVGDLSFFQRAVIVGQTASQLSQAPMHPRKTNEAHKQFAWSSLEVCLCRDMGYYAEVLTCP